MRRQDWVERLWQTVHEYQRTPFVYGYHDCGLFNARLVDAITGSTWAAELEQLYQDRRGAARLLINEGGLVGSVSRRLGSPTLGRAARRGDICQVAPRALGVCVGTDVMVLTRDGLEPRPLSLVRQFWRVD